MESTGVECPFERGDGDAQPVARGCGSSSMTPKAAGAAGEASPMESPTVTIVIPLYDGGRFIGETLRSVLAQSFRRFEVIVVDDGSTDDGPDVVRAHRSDARVRLVRNRHLGVAEARNTGAAQASEQSGYLMFLDADDLWHPDAVATLVDALDRRPDAAGAFVLAEYVDGDGNVMYPGDFPRHMRGREDLRDGRLVPRDSSADVVIRAPVPVQSRLPAGLSARATDGV